MTYGRKLGEYKLVANICEQIERLNILPCKWGNGGLQGSYYEDLQSVWEHCIVIVLLL